MKYKFNFRIAFEIKVSFFFFLYIFRLWGARIIFFPLTESSLSSQTRLSPAGWTIFFLRAFRPLLISGRGRFEKQKTGNEGQTKRVQVLLDR